jgi:hypothetical protein
MIAGVPDSPAHARGEEAVDDWISSGIERRQTLDERGDCDVALSVRYVPVYLEQAEHEVRTPAQNEHCNSSVSTYSGTAISHCTQLNHIHYMYRVFLHSPLRIRRTDYVLTYETEVFIDRQQRASVDRYC